MSGDLFFMSGEIFFMSVEIFFMSGDLFFMSVEIFFMSGDLFFISGDFFFGTLERTFTYGKQKQNLWIDLFSDFYDRSLSDNFDFSIYALNFLKFFDFFYPIYALGTTIFNLLFVSIIDELLAWLSKCFYLFF